MLNFEDAYSILDTLLWSTEPLDGATEIFVLLADFGFKRKETVSSQNLTSNWPQYNFLTKKSWSYWLWKWFLLIQKIIVFVTFPWIPKFPSPGEILKPRFASSTKSTILWLKSRSVISVISSDWGKKEANDSPKTCKRSFSSDFVHLNYFYTFWCNY